METPEQREARIRKVLKEDFPHYAHKCLKIRPKKGGLIPLTLNAVQRNVHAQLEEQKRRLGYVRALILKARQPGVSTYVEGRIYHQVTHSFGVKAFILTHHSDATENLFTMTERFHDHCPDPVKPRTGASNAKELSFEALDSSFEVGTARSGGIGRSDTIQFLHGSEVAFWEQAERHVDGLLQAVPQAPGTEVILESTANGPGGIFYNMCIAAMRGDGEYILIFIPWFDHDEYQKPAPAGWVPSEAWREYQELHRITKDQLYWAFDKNTGIALPVGADPEVIQPKFRQEYPATANEAFQTTNEDVLIKPERVLKARHALCDVHNWNPIMLGVDIARGGEDRTRLLSRQGRKLGHLVNEKMHTRNLMEIVREVQRFAELYKFDAIFIDSTGIGAGVHDRLLEMNVPNLFEVHFGGRANEPLKFVNKRAEMWSQLNDWLGDELGADVPDEEVVTSHFCAPKYSYDSNDRMKLEEKKDIKKRLGFSPDVGDAAALTFAETIGPKDDSVSDTGVTEAETYDEPEGW